MTNLIEKYPFAGLSIAIVGISVTCALLVRDLSNRGHTPSNPGAPAVATHAKELDEARVELAAYHWASGMAVVQDVATNVIDARTATGEIKFKDGRSATLRIERRRYDASTGEGTPTTLPKGTKLSGTVGPNGDAQFTAIEFPWAITSIQIAASK